MTDLIPFFVQHNACSILSVVGMLGFMATVQSAYGGDDAADYQPGIYAEFKTSKGLIVAALEFEKCPLTVANFIGLAEGAIKSNKPKGTRFYDGLTFHRVIDEFMIQGGCPEGTGRGSPGYRFSDEFDPSLKHDKGGILSMANSGPNTNGSQFFITHVATPWLDGKHTVFGHVVKGMSVVNSIEKDDDLEKVEIVRVGKEAKAFKSDQKAFDKLQKVGKKAGKSKDKAVIEKKWPDAKTTSSGLMYVVTGKGSGSKTPQKGDDVTAHYTGTLLNGKKFDSSVDRGDPLVFSVGMGRVIRGWDEAFLSMTKGEKRTLIIPPDLAYGREGRPPVIPENATLVFEVELIDF